MDNSKLTVCFTRTKKNARPLAPGVITGGTEVMVTIIATAIQITSTRKMPVQSISVASLK